MYYKQFHNLKISALGLGSLRLPEKEDHPGCIDREKAQKIIDLAIAGGINYFDTAYTYHEGDSELFIGEALSKYERDSYYLATKFYAMSGKRIQDVFEEQLKRCRTDYFDFYLFHGMDENSFDKYTDKQNDYLGYLLKQKENGRIRNLGFSSHAAPETLKRFLEWYSGFDMALIQLNYLDWTMLEAKRQYEILTDYGIPVWVMEPLKGGRLSSLNKKSAAILRNAAPEHSLSSWGFRFLMGLPNVQTVLSGMSSLEQLQDNLRTFEYLNPLDLEEQKALEKAAGLFMEDLGVPCSGYRYCCPTCPAGLDIPLLLKGYNEKNISGETWRVAQLGKKKGPEQCIGCKICLKHCPQKINIPEIMERFAKNVI